MASTLRITFLEDFIEDFQIVLKTDIGGVVTTRTWDWVTTRSSGFEVTTGTPTGIDGETTAINYEAAFDLDVVTGYTTAVENDNEILITSTTSNETFVTVGVYNNLGQGVLPSVVYLLDFDNEVPAVDNSNIEFALTKSPHYVNIPFYSDTTTAATLSLFVWDGDLGTVPNTPTYTTTIPRPTTNFEEFNVDLSKLIDESLFPVVTIDLASTTQVIDSTSDSVKWIKYVATYVDESQSIADIEGTFVAVDGYGFYNEGVNPTKPSDNILTLATIRKVSRDGFILFPFVNNGSITSIDVDSNTGEINESDTITSSDESTDIIQYLEVDVSQATTDDYITITTQPDGDIITYEVIDECRYDPIQVIFKNKFDVFDCLTLFKKSNVSSNTNSDMFINNYVSGGTYDTTKHQFQKLNVTAKKSIRANSGYISEAENILYEQLLYSDQVYFYDGTLIPVNVTSSSLEYKTRVNDKLVNYSIDFEYAYNIIQNV